MRLLTFIYKGCHIFIGKIINCYSNISTNIKFCCQNVSFTNFKSVGIPVINVSNDGHMTVGRDFRMNNGAKGNPIGCFQKCTIIVDRNATLTIGDNVGMSQTALIAADDITIGNNVKLGGGVCVWTTDFHSLDPEIRASKEDINHRAKAPVVIKDNAFIGAKSIILKGVTIGENSIVGAGSVVTKSIPDNEIWAGNPARLIRKIEP